MPRICFVTCRRWPKISESDRLAQQALELTHAPPAAERLAEALLRAL